MILIVLIILFIPLIFFISKRETFEEANLDKIFVESKRCCENNNLEFCKNLNLINICDINIDKTTCCSDNDYDFCIPGKSKASITQNEKNKLCRNFIDISICNTEQGQNLEFCKDKALLGVLREFININICKSNIDIKPSFCSSISQLVDQQDSEPILHFHESYDSNNPGTVSIF